MQITDPNGVKMLIFVKKNNILSPEAGDKILSPEAGDKVRGPDPYRRFAILLNQKNGTALENRNYPVFEVETK